MNQRLGPVVAWLIVSSVYAQFAVRPFALNRPSEPTAQHMDEASLNAASVKNPLQSALAVNKKPYEELLPYITSGPWVASCAFFQGLGKKAVGTPVELDEVSVADPQTRKTWCIEDSVASDIQFLIAAVPDPINTHLALFFDRSVEAIQWAAQDAGFFLDQYWLPWRSGPAPVSSGEDARTDEMLAQLRSKEPGLQIFRCKDSQINACPLFVFFVAESPTTGISTAQLEKALKYIRAIKPGSDSSPLKFLGPTFSGSASGLKTFLDGAGGDFKVVTGTATSQSAFSKLEGKSDPRIGYDRMLDYDDNSLCVFLDYAHKSMHLERKQIAILSESETAFGTFLGNVARAASVAKSPNLTSPNLPARCSVDPHKDGGNVLELRFPREIAVLRSAYPDQPQVAATTEQSLPLIGLPFDIRQPLGHGDDIPSFSEGELPLSQQAVLTDIAATLRREKIKLVDIGATDIFDTLFLARFVREFSPDVRIFTLDSDRLINQAADTLPFEGTLSVTNYPLISAAQGWLWPQANECEASEPRLSFPSRDAEGTYNAFLALVGRTECMRDVFPARATGKLPEPLLWLTVVSQNGDQPVSILCPPTDTVVVSNGAQPILSASACPQTDAALRQNVDRSIPNASSPNLTAQYALSTYAPPAPSGVYLTAVWVLLGYSVAICFLVAYANPAFFGGNPSAPGRLSFWVAEYFYLPPEGEEDKHKSFFVAAALLMLMVLDVILFMPMWRPEFAAKALEINADWYGLIAGLTALASLFTLLAAIRLLVLTGMPTDIRLPWTLLLALTTLVSAGWVWLLEPGSSRSEFFQFRSLEIESGVSPVLPLSVIALGMHLACWANIRRVHFWRMRRPDFPCRPFDARYSYGFAGFKTSLDNEVKQLYPRPWVKFILLAIVICAFLFRTISPSGTVEAGISLWGRSVPLYEILLLMLLVFMYTFVVSGITRFVLVWRGLRQILRRLERLPIRHAFDRLPKKSYSWTPIWYSGDSRKSYSILTTSLECLRKLEAESLPKLQDLAFYREQCEEAVRALVIAETQHSTDLHSENAAAETKMTCAAEYILDSYLVSEWDGAGDCESLEYQNEITARKPLSRQLLHLDHRGQILPDSEAPIVIAEEFVALRFVTLIRYVGLHLRSLLSFVITAFILSVLALRIYPFVGHHTIGWILVAIFLAMGACITRVFAQMARDAILSRITDTEPGKLDREFYIRLVSYGTLPLLTILASQFPAVSRFLFAWIQPAAEALH